MYDPASTLRDTRQEYFQRGGLGDGGYNDRWVKLKAGPLTFGFPNTAARVRAVKLHDLHHVLAEYETTWTGEAEIAAWEIASGCGRHYPAWFLNFGAFAIGLLIAPRRLYRAFLRGRHTGNLYDGEFAEALLDRTVGDVRTQLALNVLQHAASPSDRLAFVGWSFLSIAVSVAPWIAAIAAAIVVIRAIG